jgi:hypothetical protein
MGLMLLSAADEQVSVSREATGASDVLQASTANEEIDDTSAAFHCELREQYLYRIGARDGPIIGASLTALSTEYLARNEFSGLSC